MQVIYGNYRHPIAEAGIAMNRSTAADEAGLMSTYVETWVITGVMLATGAIEHAMRAQLLEAAYSQHYLDAFLVDELNGDFVCARLTNVGSRTGVRVVQPPSFPKGDGSEFATERTFQVTLQAEYQFPGMPQYPILNFSEQVTIDGGGPLMTMVQTITGLPQRQILAESTPYRAQQSGSAKGRDSWPTPPPPIWPSALAKSPTITRISPPRNGLLLSPWVVNWSYEFLSPGPLLGLPNLWSLV